MGKLMQKVRTAARSPKAKKLEKEMVRKAKDPKTQAKISREFKKTRSKRSAKK